MNIQASTAVDLMRSLILAMREDITTELTSPQARHRADLVDMLLVRIATEIELAQEHGDDSSGTILPTDVSGLFDQSFDPGRLAELEATIASFAAAERHRRNRIEQRLEEIASTAVPGTRSAGELNIPKETFTVYLKKKFPQDPDIEVTNLSVIPGGRSKGTILLDVLAHNEPRSIIIRRDFSAMVTGVSVTYEYPIIAELCKAGIAVPEPLWIEEDVSVIGGAFIAFSKVEGQAMGTLFQSDASPAFVRNFAATLARIHCVDVEKSDLAAKLNWGKEKHPVRAMVEAFYTRYTQKVEPIPILDIAFAWLYLQLDKIGNECSLVHGDASLHNTMGVNDKLTGMLDWEFAHAGDPAEDVCYCKQLIECIVPWSEFMNAYKENGGKDISEPRMAFFTIWRSVMLAVQMGGALAMYTSGVDRDLRVAATGFNSYPKILNNLATDLARFTANQSTNQ